MTPDENERDFTANLPGAGVPGVGSETPKHEPAPLPAADPADEGDEGDADGDEEEQEEVEAGPEEGASDEDLAGSSPEEDPAVRGAEKHAEQGTEPVMAKAEAHRAEAPFATPAMAGLVDVADDGRTTLKQEVVDGEAEEQEKRSAEEKQAVKEADEYRAKNGINLDDRYTNPVHEG